LNQKEKNRDAMSTGRKPAHKARNDAGRANSSHVGWPDFGA